MRLFRRVLRHGSLLTLVLLFTLLYAAVSGVSLGMILPFADLLFSGVVAAAILFALILSAFMGASIPVLFEKLGIDPAIAAGPLVTTSSDILGILVYFSLIGLMFEYLG